MSLHCSGCGAEIAYIAGSQSLKCPYCGAHNEIEKEEDQLPHTIESIIPLTITHSMLDDHVFHYITSGEYTPDDILDVAKIIKRKFIYLPAYLFTVDYQATWTASFGYDRTERYTEYVNKEPETRTRTVTDWRPSNGLDIGNFSIGTYAGRLLYDSGLGLSDVVDFSLDEGDITNFNPAFLQGIDVELYAIPPLKAYENLSEDINAMIDRGVQKNGQGDRQQDWHWKANISYTTKTVYVPICHAIYDYKGEEYNVWIDGIGIGVMRADPVPEDKEKKQEVFRGYIPLSVGAITFFVTTGVWHYSLTALALVGFAWGYAVLRKNKLLEYSKNLREALLTQIKASSTTSTTLSDEERTKYAKAFHRPEKPLVAKTAKDKIVLPIMSLFLLIGIVLSNFTAYQDSLILIEQEKMKVFETPTIALTNDQYNRLKEMNATYALSDDNLSNAYINLKQTLKKKQKEKLDADNRLWEKERDKKLSEVGKKGSLEYIDAFIKLNDERAENLRNYH